MQWLDALALFGKSPRDSVQELDPEELAQELRRARDLLPPCSRHPLRERLCRLRRRPDWACFDPRPCVGQDVGRKA